jgi:aminotransferase
MSDSSQRFVASHVATLPRSGIRDFFAVVAQMPEAISLGIGEPDFVTPWHIREAAIYALEQGKTHYTDNRGLITLRRAVSSYVEKNFHLAYRPDDEILTTVGVSEALDIALRALVNPGDKVLYHEPCYVSYHPSVTLVHGHAIPVATSARDQFALDPDALAAAWQPGCKVLILNFPTNPTGGVADRPRLEHIAKFAQEKDLVVLSDEIYAELTFEGEHVSIASLPGMRERTVFLHGLSKAFAMTGFRLGYACGPASLIEAMMKVHQYCMMCAPILSQAAGIEALRHGGDDVLQRAWPAVPFAARRVLRLSERAELRPLLDGFCHAPAARAEGRGRAGHRLRAGRRGLRARELFHRLRPNHPGRRPHREVFGNGRGRKKPPAPNCAGSNGKKSANGGVTPRHGELGIRLPNSFRFWLH